MVSTPKAKARLYRVLSLLLRDEPRLEDIERLAGKTAPDSLGPEASAFFKSLPGSDAAGLHKELRYEYADLFLNAGPNPAFPYESVHVSGQPVVMQEPIFALREIFATHGVHKNPEYKDLDEHIAVELELAAHLYESGKESEAGAFVADHLKTWGTAFAGQLAFCARTGFYKGLAALLQSALESPDATAEAVSDAFADADPGPGLFTLDEGAVTPGPEQDIASHCYTCGALCGMTAKVKDGVFVKATGLKGDPKGAGRLCPKGAATPKHVYSAYRLKAPMIKEDGRFRKATWEEALDKTVQGMQSIPRGKLVYFRGNDFVNWIHEGLFDHLGCPKGTHRTMCDNSNRMATEHILNDKRPWINYQESDYILHFGMNELSTSYGQRKRAELKSALKRGAKLVVFDPRKSETAAQATEWVALKPSTDGAVAMAMAYVLISEDLYNKEFVAEWTHGFEEFRARVMGEEDGTPRTPEWAEKISGVPAETIARIARELAAAKNKGVLSWTGLAQTPNSHWSTAAIQSLNGLLGTFDAPGGPSLPFKRKLKGPWADKGKPEKGDAPKLEKLGLWSGWAPAMFEEQVEDGRIQGMVAYWGDPVLSWGNSESVRRGMRKLKFSVAIEAYMCDTALLSDIILPDSTWLEQAQVKADWLYEAFISYWAEIVPPMYDTLPMWRITQEIAKRMDLGEYFPWTDVKDALRKQLEGTPWSFDELEQKGFIITDEAEYYKYKKWGSINPPEGYGSSGKSKTGKFNFVNPVSEEKGNVDPLPDHKEPEEELRPDAEYPFIFGNFRLMQHEHCSTFSNFQLMKLRGTNELWINEADAADLGVKEGDMVRISSPWGHAEIKAAPTPDIARGTLAAAGGFGHTLGLEGDPKYPDLGGVNVPGAIMKPNYAEGVGGTPPLKYMKARVDRV